MKEEINFWKKESNHIKEKNLSSAWTRDGRWWYDEDDDDDKDANDDDNVGEDDNAEDIGQRTCGKQHRPSISNSGGEEK